MAQDQSQSTSRLSLWQAASVIARRDFLAILLSRAFLFFLLGPLFPVIVGGLAGGIGQQVKQETRIDEIGIVMSQADTRIMLNAAEKLRSDLPDLVPSFTDLSQYNGEDPAQLLSGDKGTFVAILSGSPQDAVLTSAQDQLPRWKSRVALVSAAAQNPDMRIQTSLRENPVQNSNASTQRDRTMTAQAAQTLLFLLTMLLGGMVLSNLVEEKGNKIIEVLAASIPMDAVFMGKLFAMLGVSFVGIFVWGLTGVLVLSLTGFSAEIIAAPAVGWPLFLLLGVVYFATGYLVLGSLFLAIGSMAATVREVQTLSMPVTMLQLIVFFFASFAMTDPGSIMELAAVTVPFSSPFAMMARAAMNEAVWPHLLAIGWQALWVIIIVKLGANMFRRRVMKSGPSGGAKAARPGLWKRWILRGRAGSLEGLPGEGSASRE